MCRVEQCVGWCQQYGVPAAEAYLLEHYLGDYPAAIRLSTANIERCARTHHVNDVMMGGHSAVGHAGIGRYICSQSGGTSLQSAYGCSRISIWSLRTVICPHTSRFGLGLVTS